MNITFRIPLLGYDEQTAELRQARVSRVRDAPTDRPAFSTLHRVIQALKGLTGRRRGFTYDFPLVFD